METASTSCEPDPVMKQQFYIELHKNRSTAGRNAVFLTDERYEELVDEVKSAKNAPKKVPRHYWLLNKYDVLVVEDKPKLIKPLTDDEKLQFYVPDSELFDVIYNVHISINHCGRDRLIKELSPKYKNITRHDIELFLQLCIPCQHKLKGNKKGLARPFVCTEVNSRCQVNLIDFRSHPDEEDHKYILVYQDYLTKFVVLKPLKTKNADEVAFKLVDIFTLIGAPSILQSNIGPEFSSQVVLSLKKYWSQLKIVYGKPYHSRDQKRVEWDNQDIQNMLTAWMREENSTQWSMALRFIQLMKNQSYHTAIKMSPYEALFGCRVKIGLNTSNLPQEMLEDIKSEEELSEIVKLTDEPNAYTRDQEEEDETSAAISAELSQVQCDKIKTEPVEPTTSPADESKPDLSSLVDDKTNLSLNMNNKNANSSLDFCSPSPLSSELLLQTPVNSNNNDLHSSLFSYSPTENQITHELAQAEVEIHRRTLLMNDHYNRKVRREVQKDVLASNIYPNTFPMTSPQTNPTEDLHSNLQIQTKKNLPTGDRNVAKTIVKPVETPTHSYVIHNHQSSMLANMAELWKKGKFCDATIGNGTMKIMVHKIVLLALSPQLLSLANSDLTSGFFQLTFPQEIGGDALWAFSKYMYEGVVSLNSGVLEDMERISSILNLQDLKDMCNLYRNQVNLPNNNSLSSQSLATNNLTSTDDTPINLDPLPASMKLDSSASGTPFFSLPSVTQTVSRPVQRLQIMEPESNSPRLEYSSNQSSIGGVNRVIDDRSCVTISGSDSDSDLTVVSSNIKQNPVRKRRRRHMENNFLQSRQPESFLNDNIHESWPPHSYNGNDNLTNPSQSKQMKLSDNLVIDNSQNFKISYAGANQRSNELPYSLIDNLDER